MKKQYVLGNTGLLQHFFTLLARSSVEMHKRVRSFREIQVGHLTLSSYESHSLAYDR